MLVYHPLLQAYEFQRFLFPCIADSWIFLSKAFHESYNLNSKVTWISLWKVVAKPQLVCIAGIMLDIQQMWKVLGCMTRCWSYLVSSIPKAHNLKCFSIDWDSIKIFGFSFTPLLHRWLVDIYLNSRVNFKYSYTYSILNVPFCQSF